MNLKDKYSSVVFILFIVFMAACGPWENPEEGIPIEDIITIKTEGDATTLLADGNSEIRIVATLGRFTEANSMVTFRTEEGRFAEANDSDAKSYSINASSKTAKATLISSTKVDNSVVVSAKVGDFENSTTLKFVRAIPSGFTYDIKPHVLKADQIEEAEVSIFLFRDPFESKPSNGTKIDFNITSLDSAEATIASSIFAEGANAMTTIKSANGKTGQVVLEIIPEGITGMTRTITFE